jgi:hypothetical protein
MADGIVTDPSAFVLTMGNVGVIGPAQADGRWAKAYNTDVAISAFCKEVLKLFIYPPIINTSRDTAKRLAWAASYLLG